MFQPRFRCVNRMVMAGALTLATFSATFMGNGSMGWAATLDRFDMSSDDQSVKIQLYSDQRVKYSTQTQGGAFIILLEDTSLSEEQVKQGFPIVMDGQKRFVGRALPAGEHQVKIVLPNLPANQFAVSIAQKSAPPKVSSGPAQALPAPSLASIRTKVDAPKPDVTFSASGGMPIRQSKPAGMPKEKSPVSPRPLAPQVTAQSTQSNPYFYDTVAKNGGPRPRPAVLTSKPMVDEMVRDLKPLPVAVAQTTPGSQPWSSWEPKRPSKPYVSKRMRELERAKTFAAQGVSPPVSYQFERGKLIDMPPRSLASAPASTLTGLSHEPNGFLSNTPGEASPRGIIGETLGQLEGPSAPGAGNSGFSFRPEQGFSALALEDPQKLGGSSSGAAESGSAQTIEVDWNGLTQELVKGFGQGFQNIPLWAVILMALFLGGIGFFALIAAFYLISGIFVNMRTPRSSFPETPSRVYPGGRVHGSVTPAHRKQSENPPRKSVSPPSSPYQSPPPQVPRYVDPLGPGRYAESYGPEYFSGPFPADGYPADAYPESQQPTRQVQSRYRTDVDPRMTPPQSALRDGDSRGPSHHPHGVQGSVYLVKPSQDVAEAVRKGTRLKLQRRNA